MYEFMQFTGLLDKNGKEIYEGDIIRYETLHYDPSEGDSPCSFSQVEYRGSSFVFDEGLLDDWGADDIEVIGNIYENSELL